MLALTGVAQFRLEKSVEMPNVRSQALAAFGVHQLTQWPPIIIARHRVSNEKVVFHGFTLELLNETAENREESGRKKFDRSRAAVHKTLISPECRRSSARRS